MMVMMIVMINCNISTDDFGDFHFIVCDIYQSFLLSFRNHDGKALALSVAVRWNPRIFGNHNSTIYPFGFIFYKAILPIDSVCNFKRQKISFAGPSSSAAYIYD